MSKADKIFVAMCEDIINNGTTTEGQKVPPALGGRQRSLHHQAVWRLQPL